MVWPHELAQTREIQFVLSCFYFLIHYYQISNQWNELNFEYVVDKLIIQNIVKVGDKTIFPCWSNVTNTASKLRCSQLKVILEMVILGVRLAFIVQARL